MNELVKVAVLVPLPLLLWKDTMTKTAYKRKHLTGDLLMASTVTPWPSRVWEEHRGRQIGMVIEHQLSLHPGPKVEGRERKWDWVWNGLLRRWSPLPVTTSTNKDTLLNFPSTFPPLEANIRIYETLGHFSFKPLHWAFESHSSSSFQEKSLSLLHPLEETEF